MKSICLRHRFLTSGLLLLVATLPPLAAAADEAPALRFDPFGSRPEPDAQTRTPPQAAAPFKPILMSTIVRGDRSLVNLGGTILALEEESQGYRLLEVRAFDALFLKDGQRIRLEVTHPKEAP